VNRAGREVERMVRAWVNSTMRLGLVGLDEWGWALFQDWAKNLMGVWVSMGEITTASREAYVARSWTVLCWQATESGSRARMYDVPESLSIS